MGVFEEYLKRVGKKYVAADYVTLADFAIIASINCLAGIGYSFEKFKLITAWYDNFKAENKNEWAIAEKGLNIIKDLEINPPDLSKLNHPVHPVRKAKK